MELKELRQKAAGCLDIQPSKPSSCPVHCFVEESTDGKLETIDNAFLVYAPIDIDTEDSSDAQLVRAGIWNREDCGTLHIESPNFSLPIARINPKEQVDLALGWITEKGEVIIRR